MTLGSGCGSKTLIRIGAGNLKSLVVYIFLGIAAYMTLRGLFGAFRVGVLEKAAITLPQGQDLPSLFGWNRALLAALIGGAMLAFIYSSKQFRSSLDYTLGGVVTGLVVVGGWYVSGHIGHVAEDPNTLQEAFVATNTGRMESFSFVAPLRLHPRIPDALDRQVARSSPTASPLPPAWSPAPPPTRSPPAPSAGRASATPRTPRTTSSAAC